MRLEGKVAIISGGARGQGAAEAQLFAREGAAVVIGDILDEEGLKLEAEIREWADGATYVHLDVTEPEAVGERGEPGGRRIRKAGHTGQQRRYRQRTDGWAGRPED